MVKTKTRGGLSICHDVLDLLFERKSKNTATIHLFVPSFIITYYAICWPVVKINVDSKLIKQ